MRRLSAGSRGFTLIEALVAFTLLAVVLAASYRGFAQGLHTESLASLRAAAVWRAEARVATLRSQDSAPTAGQSVDGDWVETIGVTAGAVAGLYRISVSVNHEAQALFTLETSVVVP